jgi:hypothetical protein
VSGMFPNYTRLDCVYCMTCGTSNTQIVPAFASHGCYFGQHFLLFPYSCRYKPI